MTGRGKKSILKCCGVIGVPALLLGTGPPGLRQIALTELGKQEPTLAMVESHTIHSVGEGQKNVPRNRSC